ncbi:3-isopropylmalate dehydratase large subunit [Allopusillimonas ginsengisoli]|uniref:3-isopropylmalate dehydratase large subunit n=1 Tax=Allopusillimonas ginsengisoli TaxID=453575 RepID=UPI0039C17F03
MTAARTLFQKLWDAHIVKSNDEHRDLLYIDRHLVYEVTSPQAFEGLRQRGRRPWRSSTILATADHNVPTKNRETGIKDRLAKAQINQLSINCEEFDILEFKLNDPRQGIIHVIGPELGATLPGMTVVAGDSHTSTHGAFAALAFGIGTSDVEHVLATQCLLVTRLKTLKIDISGLLHAHVSAKDLILYVIQQVGAGGGSNHAIEFTGEAVRALSMESRMTLCNMAIEAGARVGLVAVDDKTIDYLAERPFSPSGKQWTAATRYWKSLVSDDGAEFDRTISLKAEDIKPMVTWGTSPDMVAPIDGAVPAPEDSESSDQQSSVRTALEYMQLDPGTRIIDIRIDKVFIGSCTNSRIEDLRSAAKVVNGKQVAKTVLQALVVPGSGLVKAQAEAEGLDKIFMAAGFEWRDPGCSMCLGMNEDRLNPGERCASTSNRNFEGRQGAGGLSHLVSPAMAAAAAIAGRFTDLTES